MNCIICSCTLKDIFYTSVGHGGWFDIYCGPCYQTVVLDNYDGMEKGIGTKVELNVCECGTKNPVGNGHSTWCQRFKKEFK